MGKDGGTLVRGARVQMLREGPLLAPLALWESGKRFPRFCTAFVTPLYPSLRTLGNTVTYLKAEAAKVDFRDANLCEGLWLIDRRQNNNPGNVTEPGLR